MSAKGYLNELHCGRPGVEATKARAADTVYWMGIKEDIERMVISCATCNMQKSSQQKKPLKMYEVPTLPCKIVATDLFEWRRQMYLVTVDSYSGFYDIDELTDTSSRSTS